jgi:hypothetical protein
MIRKKCVTRIVDRELSWVTTAPLSAIFPEVPEFLRLRNLTTSKRAKPAAAATAQSKSNVVADKTEPDLTRFLSPAMIPIKGVELP